MERNNQLKDSLGRFMRNMFDLMVLNWLWLLCCLPVITIGPATCAVYSVTLKMAREESFSTVKCFFQEFKNSFVQGLASGLIALLLLLVAAGDAWFALQQTGYMHTVFLAVAISIAAVAMSFIAYVFPLQARFKNSLKQHVINAFSLVFVSPLKTLQLWLILLAPWLFAIGLPQIAVGLLGFLYILFGFSGPMYINSRILRSIFDKVAGADEAAPPPMQEEQ